LEDRTRVHVFVTGNLDGVVFRKAIADKANELGVTGWVKSLSDGRVEAVLEGPRDEVYRVVGLCRSGGGNGANVAGVQVDREPPKNEKTFKIR
jgi:acylphosphatase